MVATIFIELMEEQRNNVGPGVVHPDNNDWAAIITIIINGWGILTRCAI